MIREHTVGHRLKLRSHDFLRILYDWVIWTTIMKGTIRLKRIEEKSLFRSNFDFDFQYKFFIFILWAIFFLALKKWFWFRVNSVFRLDYHTIGFIFMWMHFLCFQNGHDSVDLKIHFVWQDLWRLNSNHQHLKNSFIVNDQNAA